MPPLDDGTVGNNDEDNDPYYNPFATSFQSSFSSAIKPKETRVETRQIFRRRGSETSVRRSRTDHDPWGDENSEGDRGHMRASTMDSVGSSRPKTHPLAAPHLESSSNSSYSSLTDTRPRLKHLLSDLVPRRSPSPEVRKGATPAGGTSDARAKEMIVIIHQVSPKDSLPGVSLRYGISIADLRKANQLWPSDPIHLRTSLYIPLDKAKKAKDLVLSYIESNKDRTTSLTTLMDTGTLDPGTSAPFSIRRIPISQMSFFPSNPSSSYPSLSRPSALTLQGSSYRSYSRNPIPVEVTASSSSGYSVSSLGHSASSSSSLPATSQFATALQLQPNDSTTRPHISSLTSLFNSLPLARISFDSGASTPTHASEDQEHELDDVGRHDRLRGRSHVTDTSGAANVPPNIGTWELDSYPRRTKTVRPQIYFQSSALDQPNRQSVDTSRRRQAVNYTTPERNTLVPDVVRTAQLEPSPTMKLPLRPRGDITPGS